MKNIVFFLLKLWLNWLKCSRVCASSCPNDLINITSHHFSSETKIIQKETKVSQLFNVYCSLSEKKTSTKQVLRFLPRAPKITATLNRHSITISRCHRESWIFAGTRATKLLTLHSPCTPFAFIMSSIFPIYLASTKNYPIPVIIIIIIACRIVFGPKRASSS